MLRFLRPIDCDNSKIGTYAKLVDDREYSEDADQIREVLIHAHYLSQKDIEICAAFHLAAKFDDHPMFGGIESIHQTLQEEYVSA
jgi:hypothetical protein